MMFRMLISVAATILLSAGSTALAARLPNCLHASATHANDNPQACLGDPFHVGEHQTVRNAIEALGLGAASITFKGCLTGVFATIPTGKHAYIVTYKLPRSVSPAGLFKLLLPVMHELGHVFQIEHYGSMGKLMDSLQTPAQIELGADFLAGALYRWRWRAYSTTSFSASVELMGDYHADGLDYHGRPEDRAAAFQFGFDYPLTGNSRNIAFGGHAQEFWDAHETFQADDYAALTEIQ